MRYVISADQYFSQGAEPVNEKLIQYFESIPESFWTALDAVDFSKLSKPKTPNHSEEEIFEHQVFLLENIEDINDIIKKEDFLVRQGYDTIKLRLNESYLHTVQLINEGVMSSVMNFVKALVADPDPVEMGLNILRLVLDVIGIVPFTWAGFPIDVVANILSAIISLYKGEYVSMILSVIAAIDVTKTSNFLKTIKWLPKPALSLLEKLTKILCRTGSSATEIGPAVLALKNGIRTLGDKSVSGIIVSLFKGVANFFGTVAVGVLKFVTNFIKTVFNLVPIVGKYGVKAVQAFERLGLEAQLALFGRNFETAAKLLGEEATKKEIAKGADKLADTVISKKGVEYAATSPQGKAILNSTAYKDFDPAVITAYAKEGGYSADLLKAVEQDKKFMASIAGQPKALQQVAKAAKVENELIGASVDAIDQIVKKDPNLAEYFAKKYDWKPSGEYITQLAKDGKVDDIRKVFKTMLTDPAVAKNLSKAEVRAFTPWATKPEIFIKGVKNFDDTVYVLAKLTKAGGALATRGVTLKRLLNFISRLAWQRYGGWDCIKQLATAKASSTTNGLLGGALTPAVNEEDSISTGDVTVDANNAAANNAAAAQAQLTNPETKTPVESTEVESVIKKNDENIKKAKANGGKTNCKLMEDAVKATVGAHCANFPGSTAMLGGKADMSDPKAAAEFQKKSTEYTKQILKSMGLDDTIDAQHALDSQALSTKAALADVWDFKTGTVSLNMEDASRMRTYLQEGVKDGSWSQEEADAAEKLALEEIKNGNSPELKLPNNQTNEGLFRTKTFNFA
jgi:hypothetical protein